jgi:hypothetical protein
MIKRTQYCCLNTTVTRYYSINSSHNKHSYSPKKLGFMSYPCLNLVFLKVNHAATMTFLMCLNRFVNRAYNLFR